MIYANRGKDLENDYQSAKLARNEIFDIRLRNQVSNEIQQIHIPYILPEIPNYQVLDENPQYELSQSQYQENSIYYNWDNLADDAVGIILVGNSGSGKTSSACKVAELLTKNNPAHVVALDPHYNDTWELAGIESIGNIQMIETAIIWLVDELDRRRERKGLKQPLGPDYIIFVDEINSALEQFDEPKKLSIALKRLGSEGRKFGLSLIAINQSSNVDDIGISKPYRNNYLIIALNASARQLAESTWGKDDQRSQIIENTPYSCMISGCISPQIARHLSHSNYPRYQKKGLPPIGLKPINQLPWPNYPWENTAESEVIKTIPTTNINLSKQENKPIENPIDIISNWLLSRNEKTTIRQVLTNCGTAKKFKYKSPEILYIFEKLESENKGRIIKIFGIGGKISTIFLPSGIEYNDNADIAEDTEID